MVDALKGSPGDVFGIQGTVTTFCLLFGFHDVHQAIEGHQPKQGTPFVRQAADYKLTLFFVEALDTIEENAAASESAPRHAHYFLGNQALLNLGSGVKILYRDIGGPLQIVSGFGELAVARLETVFQGQKPLAGPDTGPQHIPIDRFDEEIVGPGLHALD